MRVLIVHNWYGKYSGEEAVVESTQRLLSQRGHSVTTYFRSSSEIPSMRFGRTRAFFSGIYSRAARKAMSGLIADQRPDIVHVHNVFPLISPSILGACRKAGVPVVMTVHNYRLACPSGLHMVAGEICEKCRTGREYWCILRNCEGNLGKSTGYAIRSHVARRFQLFANNVSIYITLTEFHKYRLVDEGISPERIAVIPNIVSTTRQDTIDRHGDYVAFAGRVSQEKGIHTLLAAAKKCPHIQFRIAGHFDRMAHILEQTPENCVFLGHLTGEQLDEFHRSARMVVLPSIWFETFGLTVAEAMICSKPTICSSIGALREIVDDGVTGLLFEPGNVRDLVEKIQYLWERPDLCQQMGQAGREKALREYSSERHYDRLMAAFKKATTLGPPGGSSPKN